MTIFLNRCKRWFAQYCVRGAVLKVDAPNFEDIRQSSLEIFWQSDAEGAQ